METMTNDREEDEEGLALWRTSDMALVAYLASLGKTHIRMELEQDPVSCYWVYEEVDGLTDNVLDYLEGSGTVEPKGFNQLMARLKEDMFKFLRRQGIDTPTRR